MPNWELYRRLLAAKPEQLKDIKAAIESKYKSLQPSELKDITEQYKKEKGVT